ncbi:DUF1800 domain-containing protein [Arenibacterium sp. CAU 1754]
MTFSPELADIRFGCGLSPDAAPPASPEAMLQGLTGPDRMAQLYPIDTFTTFRATLVEGSRLRKKSKTDKSNTDLREQIKRHNRQAVATSQTWFANTLLRWSQTDTALRERLVAFWADHFTAKGKMAVMAVTPAAYVEEAIRPNITGTFADLLVATTTHPLMLHFLDQNTSVGPGSKAAERNRKLKGLNENLAREVLELHTLGVDGPYTQQDVRQLAELFTGLTYTVKSGFQFRQAFSEPGSETVMGKTYGGDPAKLRHVVQALRDLAVHPATARHVARKLAVHFVADTPDPDLVAHVANRFQETGGDLMAVYGALLEHPAAWAEPRSNIKPPVDFIASSLRALRVGPAAMGALDQRGLRRGLLVPLRVMGQTWQRPNGPDGWAEEDAAWITPQGISARLRWGMSVPQLLIADLPDPRIFVTQALGPYADAAVEFAASAAESKAEAIGLVLAAPAFQRR